MTEEFNPEVMTPDQELAWDVESRFRQFMHFPHDHAHVVSTLWVLHTHMRDVTGGFLPHASPRLYFGSDVAGAGKSLATRLVTKMSHNGHLIVEPTAPGLTTLINHNKATIGLEEIDLLFGRGSSKAQIRAILNTGYEKGAFIPRQRSDEVDFQNAHAPVALNGKNARLFLNSEKFETLRSRSIPIILEQKPAGVQLDRYNPEIHDDSLRLLMRLLRQWGLGCAPDVLAIPVEGVMPAAIANRAEEIWTILFRLAVYLGGTWPKRCELAARAIVLGEWGVDEEAAVFVSPAQELLDAVRKVFGDEHEFLSTGDVIDGLGELEIEPSCMVEWVSIRSAEMGIARLLSRFGIESIRRTVGSGLQAMGYSRRSLGLESIEKSRPRHSAPVEVAATEVKASKVPFDWWHDHEIADLTV